MPTATTIVVAREDFSIPGGDQLDGHQPEPVALESRFFNLLRESKPDVVVLDLRQANGDGVGMILKIRRQSSVPILVVCGGGHIGCAVGKIAAWSGFDVVAIDNCHALLDELRSRAADLAIAIQQCYRHVFYPSRNRVGTSDVDLAHSALDIHATGNHPGEGQRVNRLHTIQ